MKAVCFQLHEQPWRGHYDDLFERCPMAFIQQSTWWAEVIAPLGPDTPIFLLAMLGDRAVAGLPLYLFKAPAGAVMVSVPQAGPLGGIFCLPGLSVGERDESFALLLRAALELARTESCLALAMILDPFQAEAPPYGRELQPDYRFENFTQWTDLRTFFDADGTIKFRDYHRRSNLSRNLARAHAAGFKVRLSTGPAEMERLYEIHLKRHAELAATPLDPRLLVNIAAVLVPRKKAFVLVVEAPDGRIASWGVYVHHQRVMDVLRLNMDSDFAAACPNFLNTNESLRLARSLGVTHYNWQSAPSRASGVYRYKEQWAAQESTYCYLTRLFCAPATMAEIGLQRLQREYPLHFIAPYAAASAGFQPGHYRKD